MLSRVYVVIIATLCLYALASLYESAPGASRSLRLDSFSLSASSSNIIPNDNPSLEIMTTGPYKGAAIEPLYPDLRSPRWTADNNRYPEERDYLEFLPNHYRVPENVRIVYIDFGTNTFDSSVGWMYQQYPLAKRFDVIYGFEMVNGIFNVPPEYKDEMDKKLHFYTKAISTSGGDNTIDAVKFLKETVTKDDFVILKMDIENYEWDVLDAMERAGVMELIDEFFVELHFANPKMSRYGWDAFQGHTLEDARAKLRKYRDMGIYAHYWP